MIEIATYEQNIAKLSRVLLSAGKPQYTTQYIEEQINKIMQEQRLKLKTQGLAVFKSDPEVKRALSMGDRQNVKFDVLSVEYRKSTKDDTNIQSFMIAIDRNGKPEIRTGVLFDKTVTIESGNAYQGDVNIGKGAMVELHDDVEYTILEKSLFTANQLAAHAFPIEDAQPASVGMWIGIIGDKRETRGGKLCYDMSSEGLLEPKTAWENDEARFREVLVGDNVIFGGYNGKTGINLSFLMVVPEEATKEAGMQNIGRL